MPPKKNTESEYDSPEIVEKRTSRKQRAAYLDEVADNEVMHEYVKNPLTQRPVLVGGPLYRKLCKKGILHDPLINQERKSHATKIVKTNLIEKAMAKKNGVSLPEPSRPQKIVRRKYPSGTNYERAESSDSESSEIDPELFKQMYASFMKKKEADEKYIGNQSDDDDDDEDDDEDES